ncbi:MAG: polysaccharide deacetylase family protein [Lachnospiraceae bacterium]|nr:polysaccharide deacetylase family protein [Lachnospiraceae bacterium]
MSVEHSGRGNDSGKRKMTKKQKEYARKVKRRENIILIVAAVVLLGVVGAVAYHVFFKGDSGENTPAPTPTMTPIPTNTPSPSPSPSPTPTPVPTNTPTPTATPTPKATPTPEGPTSTPTPTPDDGRKMIAFTFDDGPYSKLTPKFLETLQKYNAKATWFVVGDRIDGETGPQLKQLTDAGMEVQIHAWTHDNYYDTCSDKVYHEEIDKTYDKILEVTGVAPTMVRAPGGRISKERIAESPLYFINWSIDSNDWRYKSRKTDEERQTNINTIVNNVISAAGRGKIILMHEIYDNSYEAFCIIIDKLAQQGYEFVTVSEMLGEAPLGVQYYKRP